MRSLTIAVAAFILAVVLGACNSDDSRPDTQAEIKIGHLLPFTGGNSAYAPASRKAGELALQEVRAALEESGADDVSVSMLTEDEQTSEQGAVQAAQKVLSEGATILVGVWSSGGVLAAAKAAAIPQGVALITPVSTATALTDLEDDGLVSRVIPADDVQALSVAHVAEEELGADAKLSLAGINIAYGVGFARDFKEIWESGGGSTTGPVLYDPTQADLDSEAAEIVSGDPDGYVFFDFVEGFAKLSRSLLRTGDYDGERAFFPEPLGAQNTLKGTGIVFDAIEGAVATVPASPRGTDAAHAFDELFASSEREPAERYTFDSNSFDIVIMAALAGVAAGSSEPGAIAEQVPQVSSPPGKKYTYLELPEAVAALMDGEDIDYEGVSGPVDLDENGDLAAEAAVFNSVAFSESLEREIISEFRLDPPR